MQMPGKPQAVLFFPAPYSAAIANLGFLTIWRNLNSNPQFSCDRAIWSPLTEDKPRGLQSSFPLSNFPLIFISSSSELDLISVIDALIASGIEPNAKKRRGKGPIIVAGGITPTINPDPWAPVVDLALLGEGEQCVLEWLDVYLDWIHTKESTLDLIKRSEELSFVWIPDQPQRKVIPAIYSNYKLDPASSPVVHPEGHFGDCLLIEINRGCPHHCLFCAVCQTFPARFAEESSILNKLSDNKKLNSPKVGLIGAAAGDHPDLKSMVEMISQSGMEVTISSLRIERTNEELLNALASAGLRTLTVAPETGSELLRHELGKQATDDQLVKLARNTVKVGLRRLRLYFLIGLPNPEPPEAIAKLVQRLQRETSSQLRLDVRVSSFIPKPGTPFGAAAFQPIRNLDQTKQFLRSSISKIPGTTIRFESTRGERLSALLSRGDQRIGEVILNSRLNYRSLDQEFRLCSINPEEYLNPSKY